MCLTEIYLSKESAYVKEHFLFNLRVQPQFGEGWRAFVDKYAFKALGNFLKRNIFGLLNSFTYAGSFCRLLLQSPNPI